MDPSTQQNLLLGFAAVIGGASGSVLNGAVGVMLTDAPNNAGVIGAAAKPVSRVKPLLAVLGSVLGFGACVAVLLFMWPEGERLATVFLTLYLPGLVAVTLGIQGAFYYNRRTIRALNTAHVAERKSEQDALDAIRALLKEPTIDTGKVSQKVQEVLDQKTALVTRFATRTGLGSDLDQAADEVIALKGKVSSHESKLGSFATRTGLPGLPSDLDQAADEVIALKGKVSSHESKLGSFATRTGLPGLPSDLDQAADEVIALKGKVSSHESFAMRTGLGDDLSKAADGVVRLQSEVASITANKQIHDLAIAAKASEIAAKDSIIAAREATIAAKNDGLAAKEERINLRDREHALDSQINTTEYKRQLADAETKARDLTNEVKNKSESLIALAAEHAAALNTKCNEAVWNYILAARTRPLVEYLTVFAFVDIDKNHGVECHDVTSNTANADIRFGLRITNWGTQGVALHEIQSAYTRVQFQPADHTNTGSLNKELGNVFLRETIYVRPGSSCVFYEFDVPNVQPSVHYHGVIPSEWAQFGKAFARGTLVATVCDDAMSDTRERLNLNFDVAVPIPFKIAREDGMRRAVNDMLFASAHRAIEKDELDKIVQVAVASLRVAGKNRE